MSKLTVKMKENEYWYGLCVDDGIHFPLSAQSQYSKDHRVNQTNNQINPILISSAGRYVWCEYGFKIETADGMMNLQSDKGDFILEDGFNTLKKAYLAASKRFFPSNKVAPPSLFFEKPQYNTWIELIYNQNQEDILKYADSIINQGYPTGILMIDDGWSEYYGSWRFNKRKFPDAKTMVEKLHEKGFRVMLWTCPFISPDTVEFKCLEAEGCLVKNKDGTTAIRQWWNGYSAVLDFTNPGAVEWYTKQNQELIAQYKIDGFKFDAGDGKFYKDDDITFLPANANRQNELWALYGLNYKYNEYRSCFKGAGLPLVQRLADKNHSWGENGVATLIPNHLTQGISGYAYTCPDMIGGGEYMNFLENSDRLDEELFVRYAQCAALMPMMQFSAAPWRVLSEENNRICREMAKLHVKYREYIYQLAEQAKNFGEPITRYMEYEFPGEGFEQVKDQFMLGDKILVAPVCKKGQSRKTVLLPKGRWKYIDGTIYEGKKIIEVNAPISILPYFERC
ncbi:MAG: glycoside hydrolase family 31 protein [Anaerocolumna sp.]